MALYLAGVDRLIGGEGAKNVSSIAGSLSGGMKKDDEDMALFLLI
jgi:hypothetical protein